MSKLLLKETEKTENTKNDLIKIESPVNEEFFILFEKNEDKLKEDLNEYNTAYHCASQFYLK